jgi:hypothetical protein
MGWISQTEARAGLRFKCPDYYDPEIYRETNDQFPTTFGFLRRNAVGRWFCGNRSALPDYAASCA